MNTINDGLREAVEDIRKAHYIIGPSLSPNNYDDSSTCGETGRDPDECDACMLLMALPAAAGWDPRGMSASDGADGEDIPFAQAAPPDALREALLVAVEEVNNSWHEEDGEVRYREGMWDDLIDLRRAYNAYEDEQAAPATPAGTGRTEPREPFDEADGMCPNCVTPWKCNGPHLSDQTLYAIRKRAGRAIAQEEQPE